MRRCVPSAMLIIALVALFSLPALAVKRSVVKELHGEYAGRTYALRLDLRGTDYFAAFNVVNDQGIHYRGREQAILFYRMETVYLDRVSNESNSEIRLTLYRNRNDAMQIRGSIPGAPLPVGPDRDATMGSFARDLSTTVILETKAGKDDPAAQSAELGSLMARLFYLKELPTFEEKEAFILSHPDLPQARLSAITGLAEDIVRGILLKNEAGKN